jgi:putative phosphoesterase
VRVAAVSDVHGNLPALEAVLSDIERERVDAVVSCGDVAGPFGEECVERLSALRDRLHLVRGNADEGVEWPLTVELHIGPLGTALFCHGSPRSEEEILTRASSEARIEAALAGVQPGVVVCGHTHVQFDRVVGPWRLVNAGSVGMPYEGVRGAFWALLGPDVELRRSDYDVETAAAAIEATGAPGAEDQARWLREPPDPDEASAYFEAQAGA